VRSLGEATSNAAEYSAPIAAIELGALELEVRSDSEWMVRQMTGCYRIKHEGLKPVFRCPHALSGQLDRVAYVHVRQEAKREAERLANRAIDEAPGRAG